MTSTITRIALGILCVLIVPLFFESVREKVFHGKVTTYYISPTERSLTQALQEAFSADEASWVHVPPPDTSMGKDLYRIGPGGIGFEGNGQWKIHISIDPEDVPKAIPILVAAMLEEGAPRFGFKMQTQANLDDDHQIGKEFALLFDAREERAALSDHSRMQIFLNRLQAAFNRAEITSEEGRILTAETANVIRSLPEGMQPLEKRNLETGKYDRPIPSTSGLTFFHYRDEDMTAVDESLYQIMQSEGGVQEGVISIPQVHAIAMREPQFAHNPLKRPDPYLQIVLE